VATVRTGEVGDRPTSNRIGLFNGRSCRGKRNRFAAAGTDSLGFACEVDVSRSTFLDTVNFTKVTFMADVDDLLLSFVDTTDTHTFAAHNLACWENF